MSPASLFTDNCQFSSYWWDTTPRPQIESTSLPEQCDVAIIGSGYTGLNCALQTSRAGRTTVVLDAEDAGFGCSTRNGGQISTSVKPSLSELTRAHGESTAKAILAEGQNALSWMGEFLQNESIECDFRVCGRFHAAHNQKQFNALVAQSNNQPKGFEVPIRVVPRAEQKTELGTDVYHGGVVYEQHACLDPGRYHQGLLNTVMDAGAQVVPYCAVQSIQQAGAGFKLFTQRGELHAKDVVVATNGYTNAATPQLRRRVIPIGSYIIATEALEADVMNRLMPTNRIYSDTHKVVYYFRASPDRSRILFGGRVSSAETDPAKSAPLLKGVLNDIFPELKPVRVSHSWMGFVGYTFDTKAHVGKHDGLYYALGYCGSGVSMASYLGMRVGQQVLGLDSGRTGFDGLKFPTRPLYFGKPWFLPPVVAYYRWRDKLAL